jgi:hypothetical protein
MAISHERLMASHATAVIQEGDKTFNTPERRSMLGHTLVVAAGIPRWWEGVPEEFIQDLGVEVRPTDGFTLHGELDEVRIIGLWRQDSSEAS